MKSEIVKVDPAALNTARLLELAKRVEEEPQGCFDEDKPGFDMAVWNEPIYQHDGTAKTCGSCRCIGGMADILFGGHWDALAVPETNYTKTGISYALDAMFYPHNWDTDDDAANNPWHATPQQAAALIRHFAETGEVDWDWAMEAGAPVPEVPQ